MTSLIVAPDESASSSSDSRADSMMEDAMWPARHQRGDEEGRSTTTHTEEGKTCRVGRCCAWPWWFFRWLLLRFVVWSARCCCCCGGNDVDDGARQWRRRRSANE